MIEEEKKSALVDHSVKIRTQISTNESLKKQDRLDYLEEGRKVREKGGRGRLANIGRMKKEDAEAAEAKRQRINMLMKQAAEANA